MREIRLPVLLGELDSLVDRYALRDLFIEQHLIDSYAHDRKVRAAEPVCLPALRRRVQNGVDLRDLPADCPETFLNGPAVLLVKAFDPVKVKTDLLLHVFLPRKGENKNQFKKMLPNLSSTHLVSSPDRQPPSPDLSDLNCPAFMTRQKDLSFPQRRRLRQKC